MTIRNDWDWWQECNYTEGHFQKERPAFVAFDFMHFVYEIYLKHWYWAMHCSIFGHSIQDDSHAGPDDGYDSLYCENCDWEFHHTYY